MANDKIKCIQQIAQDQLRQLELEEILYDGTLVEINISTLLRPSYSSRLQVESRLVSLIKSLNCFGFLGGIFVNSSNHVIDGWHRLQLWHSMGMSTIPCYLLCCTPEQERKLHLSLNQQVATFHPSEFGIEFMDLNLKEDFGFSEADLKLEVYTVKEKFSKEQRAEKAGFTKLMTSLPIDTYDRLKAIKKETNVKSIADTITNLVSLYYESN